jgi:formylglycine-generating enzyme required for sulfatase activity
MAPEVWVGKTLDGRYRVESELGRGGMGTVYLAFDERMERPVVVKVPDPRFLDDPGFRGRFEREVRSQVQLSHAHIVVVLDGGSVEDVPYLVLTYLAGGSLKDRIEAAGGRLSPAEVLTWLPDVARALDSVHEDDVVHRDVKPANILFDGKGNVFLADFGIAKALGEQDSGLTQTGTTPGTPDYMAPETVLEVGLDGRADQYALGAVVYRALAGCLPISATNPLATLVKKTKEDPEPLAKAAPGVSDEVSEVVMKALSRDREKRFPSCAAFAKAYFKAVGSSSTPVTLVEPDAPPVEETLAGTVVAPNEVAEEPVAETEVVAGPAKLLRRPMALGGIVAVVVLLGVGAFLLLGRDPDRDQRSAGVEVAPPVVHLDPPQTTVYTREKQHLVMGRVEHAPGGRVRVGSRVVLLDEEGRFRDAVTLLEEETTLEIRGVAADGTIGEPVTLRIFAYPDPPAVTIDEPADGHLTNASEVAVRGRVEGGRAVTVVVAGVERPVVEGRFEADVALDAEGPNALRIVARDRAGHEATAVRNVIRDTTPPALELDPVESPTEADGITIGGTSEPGGEVTVDGVGTRADATDRFAVRIDLRLGTNEVSVVARDRAGNEARRPLRVERRRAGPAWQTDPRAARRYDVAMLRRFRATVEPAAWGEPRWNASGTLEVEHRKTGLVFVLVPAGTFRMGSPEGEDGRFESEGPVHPRRVGAFLLGKTECTQAAWKRGGGSNGSHFRGDDLPVEEVSWDDCVGWCRKAGLRLPSEAEWEYACRAGSTGRWCFGETESQLGGNAWFDGNAGSKTHPVGGKRPNAWGLHDMHGNVWEWCEDRWHDSYGEAGRPDDGRAWTTGSSSDRVGRGGSWYILARGCRSAFRDRLDPGYRRYGLGFRPAASLGP